MSSATIRKYSDKSELVVAAADYLFAKANEAISAHGHFSVALSGGSTPVLLYDELRKRRTDAQWDRWLFFFSDERMVPLNDERSNFRSANEGLFAPLGIKADKICAVDTSLAEEAASANYESTIRQRLGSMYEPPKFDCVLLGLGSDGHTASLFPGRPAVNELEHLVTSSAPGVLPPAVDRVTFTFPLINAATDIAFLATGSDKAPAFARVLAGEAAEAPAALVRQDKSVTWFIGEELAG